MVALRFYFVLLTAVSLCCIVVSQQTEVNNDLLMDTYVFFPPKASPRIHNAIDQQLTISNKIDSLQRLDTLPTVKSINDGLIQGRAMQTSRNLRKQKVWLKRRHQRRKKMRHYIKKIKKMLETDDYTDGGGTYNTIDSKKILKCYKKSAGRMKKRKHKTKKDKKGKSKGKGGKKGKGKKNGYKRRQIDKDNNWGTYLHGNDNSHSNDDTVAQLPSNYVPPGYDVCYEVEMCPDGMNIAPSNPESCVSVCPTDGTPWPHEGCYQACPNDVSTYLGNEAPENCVPVCPTDPFVHHSVDCHEACCPYYESSDIPSTVPTSVATSTSEPTIAPQSLIIATPTSEPSIAPQSLIIATPTSEPSIAPQSLIIATPTEIQFCNDGTVAPFDPLNCVIVCNINDDNIDDGGNGNCVVECPQAGNKPNGCVDICTPMDDFAFINSIPRPTQRKCKERCCANGMEVTDTTVNPTSMPSLVSTLLIIYTPTTIRPPISRPIQTTNPSLPPTSILPSMVPSIYPTLTVTNMPTESPINFPSATPSVTPTGTPHIIPSALPSIVPSRTPSTIPTIAPSEIPTRRPITSLPTRRPTTSRPSTTNPTTDVPSATPSIAPTDLPTSTEPTLTPTTAVPSTVPTSNIIEVCEDGSLAPFDVLQCVIPCSKSGPRVDGCVDECPTGVAAWLNPIPGCTVICSPLYDIETSTGSNTLGMKSCKEKCCPAPTTVPSQIPTTVPISMIIDAPSSTPAEEPTGINTTPPVSLVVVDDHSDDQSYGDEEAQGDDEYYYDDKYVSTVSSKMGKGKGGGGKGHKGYSNRVGYGKGSHSHGAIHAGKGYSTTITNTATTSNGRVSNGKGKGKGNGRVYSGKGKGKGKGYSTTTYMDDQYYSDDDSNLTDDTDRPTTTSTTGQGLTHDAAYYINEWAINNGKGVHR